MTTLSEILHNIADHTGTLLRVIDEPGLSGEFMTRLRDHILLEEQENTTKLQELHGSNPTPLTQKLLDHSFLLQRIIKDEAMPVDIKRELLDHFMEEHQEWQVEIGPVRSAAGGAERGASPQKETQAEAEGPGWTVGPMWG